MWFLTQLCMWCSNNFMFSLGSVCERVYLLPLQVAKLGAAACGKSVFHISQSWSICIPSRGKFSQCLHSRPWNSLSDHSQRSCQVLFTCLVGDVHSDVHKVFFFFFFFFWFCRTWTKRYLITSQTRVKRVSRIHHRTILALAGYTTGPSSEDGPVVYPANAFDSRLRGD